jgi:hypothetical protein
MTMTLKRRSERGVAMTEFLLVVPVAVLMWAGIDYFRRGYVRRLETLAMAHQTAWKLAYSNDGSCFANKAFFAGFTGENDVTSVSNVGDDASQAGEQFQGNTSSSMFMYAHANVGASLNLEADSRIDGSGGQVKGGMYITCNEVVPQTSSSDKYADQNVLTPLWDFVKSMF